MAGAELYKKALLSLDADRDPSETARLTELLARSYFKGAFQSERREEFKRRMQLAEATYDRARTLYEEQGSEALAKRSKARGLFATFWLREDPGERAGITEKCITFADDSARILEGQADRNRLAEVHNDLLTYLVEAHHFVRHGERLKEIFDRVLKTGESARDEFEILGEDEALIESLNKTLSFLAANMNIIGDQTRYRELEGEAEVLGRRLGQASKRAGTPYALSLANQAFGWAAIEIEADPVKALMLFEAGVRTAESTKDSLLIGSLHYLAQYSAVWAELIEEDVEEKRLLLEKGLAYGYTAIKNLEICLHGAGLSWAYGWLAESYNHLAFYVATDTGKKKEYLRNAIEISRKGVIYEGHTLGEDVSHSLSKAFYLLAILVVDQEEKAELLREALKYREDSIRKADLFGMNLWNRGVYRNWLAQIKAELASTSENPTVKVGFLEDAASDMQLCMDLCKRSREGVLPPNMRPLALYSEYFGEILFQLYWANSDIEVAKRANQAYEDALAYLTKSGHIGPLGAVRWKIAKVHDALGDYKLASDAFVRAAEDYRVAAKKVQGSRLVFEELGSYMEAWSLIEEARLHHDDEQYSQAAESYAKAASVLQPTKTWSHLAKHYTACSHLEKGEAQSRQEKPDESIESFNAAVKSFREAESELEDRLKGSLESQEKQELKDWAKIGEGRERYCKGRVELEEAKVLDRKGDEEASSRKYLTASGIFRDLLTEAPGEQSKREMETLMLFCDAWALMKKAEAEARPELYAKAAQSFVNAKEATFRKKFRLLALANASMCRALESGTLFRHTRNLQLYSEIKKQLETAADCYQEAGFENAAEWTQATQRLFDALVYMANAEIEVDAKRKTELFHLAEKHLKMAADLYGQAGFSSKKEEALRHLKKARGEKELLLTPIEALTDNPAVAQATVAPVSLIRDQALGADRFDAANVVGNLSLHQKELGVGSDLTLELEMANVGKTAATLIKLENIAPDGLELDRQRIPYRVEDNFIDMKGKRLEYLKTHEVKILMRAVRKGAFELRPRVLFVDEKGNYRSYEFEPAAVTIRELGISGWLKGPSK